MVLLIFVGSCGDAELKGTDESSSTVATDSETSDAADAGAESCVADPGSLGERAFAFDGTVVATAEEIDPRYPEPDVPLPRATFEVHDWFTGGSADTVEVWMQREVDVGERLLVTGEPRWGGEPLDDAIAWECGFTMPFSSEAADEWARTFAG